MPIYEFYCSDCHTVFSFFSRSVNTRKRPSCPRCSKRRLERKVSAFAIASGRTDAPEGESPSGVDETRMEQAMEALAAEAENIDENNPRQIAGLMRKLHDSAGLPMGEAMESAIERMEAGEDPEKIEEEMGDLLESEDPFAEDEGPRKRLGAIRRRLRRPAVDETLHEL